MKNLDCYTPVGQKWIRKQHETNTILEKHYNVEIKPSEEDDCPNDGWIYKDNKLFGVCEIKNRDYWSRGRGTKMTLEKLKQNPTYLVTAEKLYLLKEISQIKGINSYLFVNLINSNCILEFKISDDFFGEFLFEFVEDFTRTRYSSNDYKGDTIRKNAYLPIYDNPYFKIIKY